MKKHSIRNILISAGLLILLAGCSNLVEPKTSAQDDGVAYILITGATIKNNAQIAPPLSSGDARTALPSFSDTILDNYSFTLTGKKSNSSTSAKQEFGPYESFSKLSSSAIALQNGTWDLTLTAAKDGTELTGTLKSQKIVEGVNSLSFELAWDESSLSGSGSLDFTLDYYEVITAYRVKLATGELFLYDPATAKETALSASADHKKLDFASETNLTIKDNKTTLSLKNVPAGIYRAKIHLYADKEKRSLINTWSELVIISGGQQTKATRTMTSLNRVYGISYELNGGTLAEANTTLQENFTRLTDTITLPALTKEHYDFAGWYTDKDFSEGNKITQITAGTTKSYELYANFTLKNYTVKFDKNSDDATGTMEDQTFTYSKEQAITANAFTAPPGSVFGGWATSADGEKAYDDSETATFDQDTTLYAVWSTVPYRVLYNLNDENNAAYPATNQNVTGFSAGDLPITLVDATRTGYNFNGWYKKADFSDAVVTEITALPEDDTITLYAKWTLNEYQIQYELNDNPQNQATNTNKTTYNVENLPITLSEATRAGYSFNGWYETEDFTGDMVTEIPVGSSGERKFYAKFVIENYTITFDKNLDAATGTMEGMPFTYGEPITLTKNEFEALGYTFEGWAISATGTKDYDDSQEVTFTGSRTLYAKWTPITYTITYHLQDDLVDIATNASSNLASYTVEDLPLSFAVPSRPGYDFYKWWTMAQTTKVYISELTENSEKKDYDLYAEWTKKSYTVSFQTNGGTDVASQTVEYKDCATEPASPPEKTNNVFGGWFKNPECTQEFLFTTQITEPTTIYAKWTPYGNISNLNISFEAVSSGGDIVVEDNINTTAGTVTYTASESYSEYNWSLDGTTITSTNSSANAYVSDNKLIIKLSSLAAGYHDISLEATRDGKYYSWSGQYNKQ